VRNAIAEADGWPAGVDLLLADESKRGHLFGSLTAMIGEDDLGLLRRLAVFERVDATALRSLPAGGEETLRRLARRGALIEKRSDGKGWVIHRCCARRCSRNTVPAPYRRPSRWGSPPSRRRPEFQLGPT
jgi:hypothetical protein